LTPFPLIPILFPPAGGPFLEKIRIQEPSDICAFFSNLLKDRTHGGRVRAFAVNHECRGLPRVPNGPEPPKEAVT